MPMLHKQDTNLVDNVAEVGYVVYLSLAKSFGAACNIGIEEVELVANPM
jgi:hypothetical protein